MKDCCISLMRFFGGGYSIKIRKSAFNFIVFSVPNQIQMSTPQRVRILPETVERSQLRKQQRNKHKICYKTENPKTCYALKQAKPTFHCCHGDVISPPKEFWVVVFFSPVPS
jgi:hypothetical protein